MQRVMLTPIDKWDTPSLAILRSCSSPLLIEVKAFLTCSNKIAPSSVRVTPRELRINKVVSKLFSSLEIALLIAG